MECSQKGGVPTPELHKQSVGAVHGGLTYRGPKRNDTTAPPTSPPICPLPDTRRASVVGTRSPLCRAASPTQQHEKSWQSASNAGAATHVPVVDLGHEEADHAVDEQALAQRPQHHLQMYEVTVSPRTHQTAVCNMWPSSPKRSQLTAWCHSPHL